MELLFEIGTEELPAGELDAALAALKSHVLARVSAARLAVGDVRVFGAPRRLAVTISGVQAQAETVEETATGPSAKVAFAADGSLTPAGLGFARSRGVDASALFRLETAKGEYVAARIVREGQPAAAILTEALQSVFTAIPWKRSMRWGWNAETFSRPVHWIVALLDQQVLPVSFAGVDAGRSTRGHRFMAPAEVAVEAPSTWLDQLRDAKVMADADERRDAIRSGVHRLADEHGLTALVDEELVDEVVHLVEWPVPMIGRFDEALLEVPREVLITSMKTHQRYFAAESMPGKLANAFIFISNMVVARPEVVVAGNLRVLLARLEDARFFYREDRKRSLESRVSDLDRVVYIDRIGSIGDRTRRIEAIAGWLAPALYPQRGDIAMWATRAALLCKADLVTGMVGEFPELQGIMGRYYAQAAGETAEVVVAIDEHYAPRGASDPPASTPAGVVVAIAQHLDSLVACFALGLIPSGSADPYALRRAAIGVVRTLVAHGLRLDMTAALSFAYSQLRGTGLRSAEQTVADASTFIVQRLTSWLGADFATDIVDAVVAVVGYDYPSATIRCAELTRLRDMADFEPLAAGYKRAVNIVRKAEDEGTTIADSFAADRLELEAEKNLATVLSRVDAVTAQALQSRDFAGMAAELVTLKAPIDRFFDNVMVNAPDPALRANRLALLKGIRSVFERFADLSRIQAAS